MSREDPTRLLTSIQHRSPLPLCALTFTSAHTLPSPGFTAINKLPPQLSSLHRPSVTCQKARTAAKPNKRRNPAVAAYLGLGDVTGSAHLVKQFSIPASESPPPRPTRKRRVARNGDKTSSTKEAKTHTNVPAQTRVLESTSMIKTLPEPFISKLDESAEASLLPPTPTSLTTESPFSRQEQLPRNITMQTSTAPRLQPPHIHAVISPEDDDDDDFGQLCFDFEPNVEIANKLACPLQSPELTQHGVADLEEDDFGDDLMDDDLIDLTPDVLDVSSCPSFESGLPIKNVSVQQTQTPVTSLNSTPILSGRAGSSISSQRGFTSPVTLTTRLLAATGDEARKPIVRPAFPTAIRDRSPIIGMSSNTLLRTCFRVGEAINQSCQAAKTGNNIFLELYARVLNSDRDDLQQRFTFCDLFHAKPPYIQATYAAAIWKTVCLFEYDSARLLQQGRICRCMGTMKRNGKEWTMTVLNIWEATWDDVEWVKGIIES
ncbi:hypothetical protein C7974DRAFT_393963 [Boeremia exigua]|uniref:uncharacterized protein n=1 Tax=Boeremia exigua TaxID=749465 RepID=UPI001E8D145B|nr:uncharacterized protein C7974DRAFT_393963 [Boeremia exigua]KAH6629163.1 hypothetical protein C7974DRAFT_393963 [Boeremia exigua]